LPLHRKAYEIYVASGTNHHRNVFPLLSIAYIELQSNNPLPAEEAARAALEHFRQTVPGTFMEGVAACLVGLALEQQGDSAGTAMVEDSHDLIAQYEFGSSPYPALCRVPGYDR